MVGPSLSGIVDRAANRIEGLSAREYILLSIMEPGEYVVDGFVDQMPTNFENSLSGEEIDGVIAYLMSLQ